MRFLRRPGLWYGAAVSRGLIERNCPVCGSAARREFLRKQTLELVSCTDCSMVYATPLPPEGCRFAATLRPLFCSGAKSRVASRSAAGAKISLYFPATPQLLQHGDSQTVC